MVPGGDLAKVQRAVCMVANSTAIAEVRTHCTLAVAHSCECIRVLGVAELGF